MKYIISILRDNAVAGDNMILFYLKRIKIILQKQKIFRINGTEDNFNFKEKIICVYEYEAKGKED